MPGRSDHEPRTDEPFDALARAAAGGISRRRFARLVGSLVLTSIVPSRMRAALAVSASPPAQASVKKSGMCPAPDPMLHANYKGTCGLHEYLILDENKGNNLVVGCRGDWIPIPGMRSVFNGCGPAGGIDLPIFGKGDYVPDRPFGLADFFDACKGHDCCYGDCTSPKSDCDGNFLRGMVAACESRYSSSGSVFDSIRSTYCYSMALTYYTAVSRTSTGTHAYNSAKSVCTCCVSCEQNAAIKGIENPGRFQFCGPEGEGTCTDILTDSQNCGACGTVCPPEASACCNGECHTHYECYA